ncbi:hypothetical protein PR048_007927 [Dryococelus australis]|uniref:Uncharacterized protein n=1 Tax=Dryococelus australis TaxID=614101 RepID=A0ABQ9HVM1_9NEOP|nr:hypothetical protein PR048_007927 [Dryococelus australis]
MKRRGERESPDKTRRRPVASSGTIHTCQNSGSGLALNRTRFSKGGGELYIRCATAFRGWPPRALRFAPLIARARAAFRATDGQEIAKSVIGNGWAALPGRGDVVVRLLASHQGELSSIAGGINPGFSQMGIVPDDEADRWIFLEIISFRSFHSDAAPFSPHFTPIGSQDPNRLGHVVTSSPSWPASTAPQPAMLELKNRPRGPPHHRATRKEVRYRLPRWPHV